MDYGVCWNNQKLFFFKDQRSTCSFDQIQPAIYQHQYLKRRKKKLSCPLLLFVKSWFVNSKGVELYELKIALER
ncbi:hypothetical protein WN944_029642 [Citrus x changshan-huyou]|uniref:Uncharacterized protein n=1 Tax=Citrus x changshan-huyou TaxID=2935761 RepID=A0AAP0LIF0_9ROSI